MSPGAMPPATAMRWPKEGRITVIPEILGNHGLWSRPPKAPPPPVTGWRAVRLACSLAGRFTAPGDVFDVRDPGAG